MNKKTICIITVSFLIVLVCGFTFNNDTVTIFKGENGVEHQVYTTDRQLYSESFEEFDDFDDYAIIDLERQYSIGDILDTKNGNKEIVIGISDDGGLLTEKYN